MPPASQRQRTTCDQRVAVVRSINSEPPPARPRGSRLQGGRAHQRFGHRPRCPLKRSVSGRGDADAKRCVALFFRFHSCAGDTRRTQGKYFLFFFFQRKIVVVILFKRTRETDFSYFLMRSQKKKGDRHFLNFYFKAPTVNNERSQRKLRNH